MRRLTGFEEASVLDLYVNKNISTHILAKKFNVTNGQILYAIRSNNGKLKLQGDKRYYFNTHFLDSIDTEQKAYFLGFVYADGCNYIKRNQICIELNERDRDILEKFTKLLNSSYPVRHTFKTTIQGNTYGYLTFRLEDHYFSQRCLKLGVVPRKSKILRFPKKLIPDRLINHFIRGYFDGDGCISYIPEKRSCANISIISSRRFCIDLKRIIDSKIYKMGCIIDYKATKEMALFATCGNGQVLDFLNWLYKDATLYLDRKYKLFQFFKEHYVSLVINRDLIKKHKLDEILKSYPNGETIEELAVRLSCSPHTIVAILKGKSIKIRNKWETYTLKQNSLNEIQP